MYTCTSWWMIQCKVAWLYVLHAVWQRHITVWFIHAWGALSQYWWLAGGYDLEMRRLEKWLAWWLRGGFVAQWHINRKWYRLGDQELHYYRQLQTGTKTQWSNLNKSNASKYTDISSWQNSKSWEMLLEFTYVRKYPQPRVWNSQQWV